jgi:hypothetical protein
MSEPPNGTDLAYLLFSRGGPCLEARETGNRQKGVGDRFDTENPDGAGPCVIKVA